MGVGVGARVATAAAKAAVRISPRLRARGGPRGRWRGTRRGRRPRASTRTRRSTVRCREARRAGSGAASRSAPGSMVIVTFGDRGGRVAISAAGAVPRHREILRRQGRERRRVGEPVGDRAVGRIERLPDPGREACGDRAGADDRDLLADDRPRHQLGPVGMAGHPQVPDAGHERCKGRVGPSVAFTDSGSASRSNSRRVRATAAVRSRRSSRR